MALFSAQMLCALIEFCSKKQPRRHSMFNQYSAQAVRDSSGRRPVVEGLFYSDLRVEKKGVAKYGVWNVFVPLSIKCKLGDLTGNVKFSLLAQHMVNVRGINMNMEVRAGISVKGIRCIKTRKKEYRSKGKMIFDRRLEKVLP